MKRHFIGRYSRAYMCRAYRPRKRDDERPATSAGLNVHASMIAILALGDSPRRRPKLGPTSRLHQAMIDTGVATRNYLLPSCDAIAPITIKAHRPVAARGANSLRRKASAASKPANLSTSANHTRFSAAPVIVKSSKCCGAAIVTMSASTRQSLNAGFSREIENTER